MTAAIAQFIRNTPKDSLRAYFKAQPHPIAEAVNWNDAQDVVQPLLQAVDKMTNDQLALLKIDAERIDTMTDETGQTALLTVVDDYTAYETLKSAYDRALWVFLRDKKAFQQAEDIRFADEYRLGRDWDGFLVPQNLPVSRDPISLEEFKQAVIALFKTSGNIKVEIFDRTRANLDDEESSLIQVMVYREDLPASYLAFEKDDLVTKVIRPVQEVAFTYDGSSGELEVVAKSRECREGLVKIFAAALLKTALDDAARVPMKRYEISKLLQPFNFETDADDGIESVAVTLLKLKPYESARKVTLEVPPKNSKSIYDVSREWFDAHDPLRCGFLLAQVRLSIRFKPDAFNVRGKTLPVKITWPNGCDLKSRTEKERLIGEKYLKRWGIQQELAA